MFRTKRGTARAFGLLATGLLSTIPSGPLTTRGITVAITPETTLTIGAVHVGGWVSAAFAQGLANATLENVTLNAGPIRYTAPRILFEDATLGQAELAALFNKDATEPFAPRLARLSAKRITIPELVANQDIAGQKQETRYRNLVANDTVNGRIAAITVENAAITGSTPQGETSGTMGRMSITGFDVAELAKVFAGTGGAEPPKEFRPIYGQYSIDSMTITQAGEVEMRFGQMKGDGFSARPTKRSLSDLMSQFPTPGTTTETMPVPEQLKVFNVLAELFDSIQFGTAEVTNSTVKILKGDDRPDIKIARIGLTGEAPNRPAETRLEGLDVTMPNGHFRLGSVVFNGYSFASPLAELKKLTAKDFEKDLDAETIRRLIPTIGTMRIAGLDMNVTPKPDEPGDKPEPVRLTLKSSELTAEKPLNGVPTRARIAIDNLVMAIDPATEKDGLKIFADLGYKNVDLSMSLATAWNEARSELEVSEVILRGAEMGSATLRGTVGNVGRDVFDADNTVALVALIGATYKTLDVAIENTGLFQRLLASEGKKKGKNQDAMRREFAAAAAVAIPAMLGNSSKAKAIGQSVARFVAKPGRLLLSAKTKDADGLGIADLAGLQEPAAILERLEITTSAE